MLSCLITRRRWRELHRRAREVIKSSFEAEPDMGQDWFEITPFPDRIFRISEPALGPLHGSHSWLVLGDHKALLIDTGVGVAPLAPVITSLTRLPVICILSHTHYDHIGGAHEFADRRMHWAEIEIMANPTPELTFWGGWLTADSFTYFPSPDYDFAGYALKPALPTGLLHDGDTIDLGGRLLEVLHVPGHSPGLLAVYETETGALFSTDALYDGEMFFNLRGSNTEAARDSLRRLAGLGARVLYPGHYENLDAETLVRVAQSQLAQLER